MRTNPRRLRDTIPPPPPVPTFPSPKPQPDEYVLQDEFRDLRLRVDRVEERLGSLFKRSAATIVAADVLVGVVKLVMEHWPK